MKLDSKEFKQLQKHWYELLAESGFKDIERIKEDGECVLIQAPGYWAVNNQKLEPRKDYVQAKTAYFRLLGLCANAAFTMFRNDIDEHILIRRSEGAQIKTIVEELAIMGTPRDRYSVRIIIRRYEMKWGLKYYTPKQLHIQRRS